MIMANAARRYVITVDLNDLIDMLGGEMIAKVVNDDGNVEF